MKKILYFSFLFLGLFLTSCKNQRPQINIGTNPLIIMVGDSAYISVSDANYVNYEYSKTRDESYPVFEISDYKGEQTTVHALNTGTDTLFVCMQWSQGIFAYGLPVGVIIKVIDNE